MCVPINFIQIFLVSQLQKRPPWQSSWMKWMWKTLTRIVEWNIYTITLNGLCSWIEWKDVSMRSEGSTWDKPKWWVAMKRNWWSSSSQLAMTAYYELHFQLFHLIPSSHHPHWYRYVLLCCRSFSRNWSTTPPESIVGLINYSAFNCHLHWPFSRPLLKLRAGSVRNRNNYKRRRVSGKKMCLEWTP